MPRDYADDQTLEPDVEAEVHRLAELPLLNYEVVRDREAERLGLRKSTLDTAVENVRRHRDSHADAAPAITVEAEPWTEPVDGDALLDNIVTAVRRYLVLPDGAAEVVALWVLHAHSFEVFYHTPRLWITAPEKRCGKTILLDVLECLTPHPHPHPSRDSPAARWPCCRLAWALLTPAVLISTPAAAMPAVYSREVNVC